MTHSTHTQYVMSWVHLFFRYIIFCEARKVRVQLNMANVGDREHENETPTTSFNVERHYQISSKSSE